MITKKCYDCILAKWYTCYSQFQAVFILPDSIVLVKSYQDFGIKYVNLNL
jgi:hypothetical protein